MGIVRGIWERREYKLNAATSVLANGLASAIGKSGVTVSESTAISYSAVYACVKVLAEDVASLPLPVYRRLVPRGKERATTHPLYRLLHDRPNPEQSSFQWRETMMFHLGLWGNFYAEIETADGWPIALWPITPKRVRPSRENGVLKYYVLAPNDTIERPFTAGQILHIPGLSYNGVTGLSPISAAREAIALGLATEEFGSRFFGEGARPGVVLEHPGKLTPEAQQNLIASWDNKHQGLNRAQRTAVLQEGMKVHEVGIPPEDAQFLETRKFQVREICRFYRMQPHKIQDLEQATFSNIEHQAIEHVVDTLRPWLVRIEQALKERLIPREQQAQFFPEFLIDGLLRGDIKSRYEAYHIGRQDGVLSPDDIRDLENMNPLPDGIGGQYWQPLNMSPATADGMSPQQRYDALGGLVRAGFDPEAAAAVLGLPAIKHTGLVPVTVKSDAPPAAPANRNGHSSLPVPAAGGA